MAKMNATSLFVATNQIVMKANEENPQTWQDLYRLVPYLRNSLGCVVCGNLLINPLTPSAGKCQHHVCMNCKGGKKKLKPTCLLCKSDTYTENKPLRALLQCYKHMCTYIRTSSLYNGLLAQRNLSDFNMVRAAENLMTFIKEGMMHKVEYINDTAVNKAAYSMLPCVYTNSSTQTLQNNHMTGTEVNKALMNNKILNGTPSLYSVMYAGSGNKITIKRKPKETEKQSTKKEFNERSLFKKPVNKCVVKPRRGCRCGNATAMPGKLTCCGQRCPCYVESKACMECKCRGCRNPHTPDGNKILKLGQYDEFQTKPHAPVTQSTPQIKKIQTIDPDLSVLQHVKIELDANLTIEQLNEHLKVLDTYGPLTPAEDELEVNT